MDVPCGYPPPSRVSVKFSVSDTHKASLQINRSLTINTVEKWSKQLIEF